MIRLISSQLIALIGSFVKTAFRSNGVVSILVTGIVLIFATNFLANLYVGDRVKILQTSGFFLVGIWGVISSIYLGASVVNSEIKDKTIYLLLVRPMSRITYITGKWLGIVGLLFLVFVGMSIAFLCNIKFNGIDISINHYMALVCIFMEWCLLATFSLMFSTFTTPFLNAIFVYFLWVFGHLINDILVYYRNVSEHSFAFLLKIVCGSAKFRSD